MEKYLEKRKIDRYICSHQAKNKTMKSLSLHLISLIILVVLCHGYGKGV